MPIAVEQLEARIYLSIWVDFVSLEDMRAAAAHRQELADAEGAQDYISIVDVSRVGSIPFNLDALRETLEADTRVIAFLVIGVNLQARIFVESLMKTTHVKIEFAASTEDALKRARALIDEG